MAGFSEDYTSFQVLHSCFWYFILVKQVVHLYSLCIHTLNLKIALNFSDVTIEKAMIVYVLLEI